MFFGNDIHSSLPYVRKRDSRTHLPLITLGRSVRVVERERRSGADMATGSSSPTFLRTMFRRLRMIHRLPFRILLPGFNLCTTRNQYHAGRRCSHSDTSGLSLYLPTHHRLLIHHLVPRYIPSICRIPRCQKLVTAVSRARTMLYNHRCPQYLKSIMSSNELGLIMNSLVGFFGFWTQTEAKGDTNSVACQ